MPKPEMEFTDTASAFLWQPVPGAPAGLEEKILSRDPETGDYTRLLRFPPGFRGIEVLTHDFWEEVMILEGSFHDLTLGCTFMPGWIRLPAARHAPRPL